MENIRNKFLLTLVIGLLCDYVLSASVVDKIEKREDSYLDALHKTHVEDSLHCECAVLNIQLFEFSFVICIFFDTKFELFLKRAVITRIIASHHIPDIRTDHHRRYPQNTAFLLRYVFKCQYSNPFFGWFFQIIFFAYFPSFLCYNLSVVKITDSNNLTMKKQPKVFNRKTNFDRIKL